MKFIFVTAMLLVVLMEVVGQASQEAVENDPSSTTTSQRRSFDPSEPMSQILMDVLMECLKRAVLSFLGYSQPDQTAQIDTQSNSM